MPAGGHAAPVSFLVIFCSMSRVHCLLLMLANVRSVRGKTRLDLEQKVAIVSQSFQSFMAVCSVVTRTVKVLRICKVQIQVATIVMAGGE